MSALTDTNCTAAERHGDTITLHWAHGKASTLTIEQASRSIRKEQSGIQYRPDDTERNEIGRKYIALLEYAKAQTES